MSKKTNETFRSGGIVQFGERLKAAMGEQSNVSLAKKCGLSETVIRGYLSGKTYPSIDKLPALAEAVGKSIEWLVTGEEDENKTMTEPSMSPEELSQWWSMIQKSLTLSELASVVIAFQENGKKALLGAKTHNQSTPELSQNSINTALMLESLNPEVRREILAQYGIAEQNSPVAPDTEPHKKAV
ncbi:helix-turn-helix domain-containing protein [Salmonella enterica]|uniref:helix-turn-helix domain-containing protein n=1 Tax=Salmonella enterica TaxID=28901 RepID=UPI0009A9B58A|nr:helix-turn-helix transcriptional regulator [Salmonella enterica]EEU8018390.1 helix-turn-helix transcriptional regulator [Salmonella enterica subsp. enterica serovar Montevideo]EDD0729268.1 helix-turn-helix transcriptional regulator [Salmonella enterica]EDI8900467.1 XRE family transcriptional regulator [Salmonella enterica]EIF1280678.1 helix-turn-helix transcriptional regulator [Salmonella enterica]EIF9748273.1 helix-turn-helix transcriptional regulator [Salmonella enterica]